VLLGSLRIRGKLALLVTTPLLAVVVLAVPVVLGSVEQARRAADTASAVKVAGQVGGLVRDLQQERLLMVGLLGRLTDPAQLQSQIATVTTSAANVRAGLGAHPDPGVVKALDAVQSLSEVRAGLATGKVTPDQLMPAYAGVIKGLIDALRLEDGVDVKTTEGRQVVALDAVLRTDEDISVAAADLMMAVIAKNVQALVPFMTDVAVLQAQSNRVTMFATPAQVNLYNGVQGIATARLGKDFNGAAGANPLASFATLTPQLVYPALQSLIGAGRGVELRIVNDVTNEVTKQKNQALTTAYAVGGGALLVVLLVMLLVMAVGRAVVRPLTRLTRSADRVARAAETELTRVADDEAEAATPLHLEPVDVSARDEIGDLARAFERVQGTASRLVERQVLSRRNVAQMFGHVGRRTQNLVGRQIALIDRLERDESNPQRLQVLYRLDHVSSRLRRNAGSLVVLSGATGANEQLDALPLADVIRLAMAEIEDYVRVDVEVPPGIVLVPNVINDIVLILAELMENATVFSPPHTRVSVYAQATPYGAQLAVVDRGIGLSANRLAEENARLARRERLDLAPTEVLGLFVVGRLSRRHGLGVELSETPGGGVTALLTFPDRMLAGTPAGGPAQPADRPATNGRSAAPVPVLGAFDLEQVRRASRSIESGGRWNAFIPHQRNGSPELPARPVPPAVAVSPALPVPPPVGSVPPPLRQRVPGAQIPEPLGQYLAGTPEPAEAAGARALVDEYQAGIGRAQAMLEQPTGPIPAMPARPAAPAPARGSAAPLSRRIPGATLDPDEAVPVGGVLLQSESLDPVQARDLVEQFESGVLRALHEVRPEHQ
jgi:signal transduction histidine kinase